MSASQETWRFRVCGKAKIVPYSTSPLTNLQHVKEYVISKFKPTPTGDEIWFHWSSDDCLGQLQAARAQSVRDNTDSVQEEDYVCLHFKQKKPDASTEQQILEASSTGLRPLVELVDSYVEKSSTAATQSSTPLQSQPPASVTSVRRPSGAPTPGSVPSQEASLEATRDTDVAISWAAEPPGRALRARSPMNADGLNGTLDTGDSQSVSDGRKHNTRSSAARPQGQTPNITQPQDNQPSHDTQQRQPDRSNTTQVYPAMATHNINRADVRYVFSRVDDQQLASPLWDDWHEITALWIPVHHCKEVVEDRIIQQLKNDTELLQVITDQQQMLTYMLAIEQDVCGVQPYELKHSGHRFGTLSDLFADPTAPGLRLTVNVRLELQQPTKPGQPPQAEDLVRHAKRMVKGEPEYEPNQFLCVRLGNASTRSKKSSSAAKNVASIERNVALVGYLNRVEQNTAKAVGLLKVPSWDFGDFCIRDVDYECYHAKYVSNNKCEWFAPFENLQSKDDLLDRVRQYLKD